MADGVQILYEKNRCNSVAEYPIALQFGAWVHYGFAEATVVLNLYSGALYGVVCKS